MADQHPRAWLLAFIVPGEGGNPPHLRSMSTYSERHPTSMKGVWAQILVGHGNSYQEGIDDIRRQVEAAYPWLEPYIGGGRLDEVPVVPMDVPEAVGEEIEWGGWPLGDPPE